MILPQFTSLTSQDKLRNTHIIRQIIDCYSFPHLMGKFRFEPLHDFDLINVFFTNSYVNLRNNSQLKHEWTLELRFPKSFPNQKVIATFYESKTQIPNKPIIYTLRRQNMELKDIFLHICQIFEQNLNPQFIQQNVLNRPSKDCITKTRKSNESRRAQQKSSESFSQQNQIPTIQNLVNKKLGRKNVSMTGCADRQLTQTKNLNRHFRSKLREVHRDLDKDEQSYEDARYIEKIFAPNRVGFEDIRKSLKNPWFNKGVKQQMKTGRFLHKILRGMMGIKSKKLMIKYYHVMASAVEEPQSFIKWKYE